MNLEGFIIPAHAIVSWQQVNEGTRRTCVGGPDCDQGLGCCLDKTKNLQHRACAALHL